MALDALRSTFRRPGSAAAPMAQAGSAAPAAGTFQPGTPSFPPAAPLWGQPSAAAPSPAAADPDTDATGAFDAVIAAVEAAREPYGLPAQQMTGSPAGTGWTVPPVAVAAPAAAVATQAASSFASDQYATVFADPIAGGGTDDATFGCPSCGRTLDHGTFHCEGCGAWLLIDMPLKRAASLVGGGLVAGILVTTLLVNVFAPPKAASVVGLDGANGGAGSGAAAPAIEVPTGAVAALRGTTAINGRLAAEATALRKALGAKKFKTGDVQKLLRRMAIDARAGAGMLGSLGAWPEAAGQRAALDAFYDDLQRHIDTGLNASVRSAGAYKKAAKAILSTLGTAPAIDTDARTLAGQVGVDLLPVAFPDALR
jgi:hypothetical protein